MVTVADTMIMFGGCAQWPDGDDDDKYEPNHDADVHNPLTW